MSHSDRLATGKGSFLTISVSAPLYGLLIDQSLPDHPAQLPKTRSQLVVRRLIKALLPPVSDALVLESYCLELVEHISAPATTDEPSTPWLRKVREAMNELSEAPVSIAKLSEDVGVHPVHLARSFKRAFGCTPGEMRSARRLSIAAGLLTTSRRALVEIAADCGYSDQSHFSNELKRCLGFTPGRFRELTAG